MAQPHMQALVTNVHSEGQRDGEKPEIMFFQFGSWHLSKVTRLVGMKCQNPRPGQDNSLYHVLGKPEWAATCPSYAGGPWGHPETQGD